MKISLLMPAHNEWKSIRKSLDSIIAQTRSIDEIIVVNDGSTDDTGSILDEYALKYENIHPVHLEYNTGNKSKAQEKGISYITGDVVVMTDADTILDKNFVKNTERRFLGKNGENISAVGGYVMSLKHNWMTACRAIDYVIGQFIFKKAQAIIDYVYVMPGCATTFRTDVLRTLIFYHDTVTEDLDFTFQMHLRWKKIYYEETAIVYTQDPPNLSSYMRQMGRWYGGGWQNLRKYWRIIMHRPAAAFVISSIFVDGVIYGFINLLLPFLYPQVFFLYILPMYLATAFVFAVFAAIHNKRADLLLYFPHFVFIGFVNSYIIIKEFLLEVVIWRRNLTWNKVDRVSL